MMTNNDAPAVLRCRRGHSILNASVRLLALLLSQNVGQCFEVSHNNNNYRYQNHRQSLTHENTVARQQQQQHIVPSQFLTARNVGVSLLSERQNQISSNSSSNEDENFEAKAWLLPPMLGVGAFTSYDATSQFFHSAFLRMSDNTWTREQATSVQSLLNGPLSLSISFLLGTLVSMTIQTLFGRQTTMHTLMIGTIEEVRELQLLVEGFPEPYRIKCNALLDTFLLSTLDDFERGDLSTQTLRQKREMSVMLLTLNKLSMEKNAPNMIVSQAYNSINNLKDLRSQLISAIQTVFSPAHYINMMALAGTMLFVFLLETESSDGLVTIQLGICWGLLIATYTMLAVIIYDLATPFSGIFRAMHIDLTPTADAMIMDDIRDYALALDDDELEKEAEKGI